MPGVGVCNGKEHVNIQSECSKWSENEDRNERFSFETAAQPNQNGFIKSYHAITFHSIPFELNMHRKCQGKCSKKNRIALALRKMQFFPNYLVFFSSSTWSVWGMKKNGMNSLGAHMIWCAIARMHVCGQKRNRIVKIHSSANESIRIQWYSAQNTRLHRR